LTEPKKPPCDEQLVTDATAERTPTQAEQPVAVDDGRLPRLWHVVVMALIAIAFTAAFLNIYDFLNRTIWINGLLQANRWLIPVGVLGFSLVVGLCQKFLQAPNMIHGGFAETLKGSGPRVDYKTFPGALLSSWCSILSGASIGPEGPITVLVQQISMWFRERLNVRPSHALGFDVAALASALNGVVGNPLFTAVFATEYRVGGVGALGYLMWNLLAGVIGFSFYVVFRLTSFASFVAFPPVTNLQVSYFVWALVLGVVGGLVAIASGVTMQVFGQLVERLFKGEPVSRALAAGVVVSLVGLALPQLLFSGEDDIHTILANPAAYGVGLLLVMGVAKLLLLGLSLKSGYLGGPTFPLLFACTMIGLALHLVFPDAPLGILVMCIEGPAIAVALSAPLTAILLVAVIGTADPDTLALIVLSTVVGMLIGNRFKEEVARRRLVRAAAVPAPAAGSLGGTS
jgi:H+/Cl- antiporter ClcA